MKPIYVIDTETTGLNGAPVDHVVDIGIAAVDPSTGEVWPVYQSLVGYNVSEWDDAHRDAWVFCHTDLRLCDIGAAPPLDDVRFQVAGILAAERVTSYNVPFDFGKFLNRPPWSLSKVYDLAPDIMEACTPVVADRSHPGSKHPRLINSYGALCPDDPAGLAGTQRHRAQSDALAAAYVLRELISRGEYPEALS